MPAGEVGSYQLTAFTVPQNDTTADATEVLGNDEDLREAHNSHDNDGTIHFLSGATGDRPAFGTVGRKFLDTTTKRLYYDTGAAWVEVAYALLAGPIPASSIGAGTFGTAGAGDFVFPGQLNVQGQGVVEAHDAGNSGAALGVDWDNGNNQKITLTANTTLTFSNPIAGATYVLVLVQDGTGSRTVTWPAAVRWPGGTAPTLTTTAARVDVIVLYYDGATYLANVYGTNFNVA